MKRSPAIAIALSALLMASAQVLMPSPLLAGSVTLAGTSLSQPYITRDGLTFVALDDIAQPLGLSVLFDGQKLLIGGTVNGSLAAYPSAHAISLGGREVDYGSGVFQENGKWYVPEGFLAAALGIRSCLDQESGDLGLYPIVVAITPVGTAVRITSSLPPDFTTCEYTGPSRRVIDISDAFLPCGGIKVQGSDLGIAGVTELRASQYCLDPPTVRVVLEWSTDTPPSHTLFLDGCSIEVLIATTAFGTVPAGNRNLLEKPTDSTGQPKPPDPQIPPKIQDAVDTPTTPSTNPQEPGGLFMVPRHPTAPGETDPSTPPPEKPPDSLDGEPSDSDVWNVALETGEENQVTATISTPPFVACNDFTLAGDGMRLVIDLQGTVLTGDDLRFDGVDDIRQVRFGQFQPQITRIVFDLNRVLPYQIEKSPSEGKIVVTLFAGDLTGKVIVIDPGHGGDDPGAVHEGIMEKDLNLEMAFILKAFLEEHGATVVLTRETDVQIYLASRIELARQQKADLFVCIHNNATEEPTAIQGLVLLYDDTSYLPLYRLVHRGVAARTGVPGMGPVPDIRGLYILRHAGDIPVLFIEGAFMTNPIDIARLADRSRAYIRNIMAGVLDGILAYYAGRDLPPVAYPRYGSDIRTGVFDLAGRPIVLPGQGEVCVTPDTGSAWDTPDEASNSDDSSDEASNDDDSTGEDSDEDITTHKLRGRGSYRYRD